MCIAFFCILLNIFIISRFDKLSDTSKYHNLSSIEHLLAKEKLIVDAYGLEKVDSKNLFFGLSTNTNTSLGGIIRSKFSHKTNSQFLSFCNSLENSNFVYEGKYSGLKFHNNKQINITCQNKIKDRSEVFVSYKDYIFWIFP